jgi:sugar (pentulose or hexulose) kinase
MTQLLTIDAGTTSIKVAVFDETGLMLATSLQEYTLLTPAVDRVELPVHVYWQSAVAGIQEVLAAARVNSGDIAAVGVTGQGETIIPIDRDGRALRNAIVWLDNRAAEEAQQIATSFDLDLFYETTGLPEIIPTWPACKVLWIRNRESDVFARMHKVMLERRLLAVQAHRRTRYRRRSLYFDGLLRYS